MNNHRVQILDPVSGECLRVICGNGQGSADNQLNYPCGVAVDSQSRLFVADTCNHRVQIFDVESGELLHTLGETGVEGSDEKHFTFPRGVAVDSNDNVYVCDSENKRVCVFDASLKFVRSFGQDVLTSPVFCLFQQPRPSAGQRLDSPSSGSVQQTRQTSARNRQRRRCWRPIQIALPNRRRLPRPSFRRWHEQPSHSSVWLWLQASHQHWQRTETKEDGNSNIQPV